jgi:hypothetical protein
MAPAEVVASTGADRLSRPIALQAQAGRMLPLAGGSFFSR